MNKFRTPTLAQSLSKFHEEKAMFRVGTVVRTLILCGLALTTLAFAQTDKSKTIVTYPSAFAVSQRVAELPIDESIFAIREMPEPRPVPLRSHAVNGPLQQEDPVLQKEIKPFISATAGVDFDGVPAQNYAPSDANLAVGPNHIVETVNVRYAVYNKSGTILAGPTNITTFFAALGGNCASGASDPIVNYDRLADRWVVSDIGIGSGYSECVAVSKTNDPAGAYFLYAYSFGANLNDYPKVGVWPTTSNAAYLATYNIFQNGQSFLGADLCAFDRTKMLAGTASAAQLCKRTPNNEGGYLPSDIDGPTAPTDGTPGLFLTWQNNNPGELYLRKLTLNFATSTATLSSPTTISVANQTLACGNGGTCVPQLGTTQTLDTLGDRLMYRFAVRHFSDHDRAVVNHAVASGSQVAVRWYELYDPAGTVTLNQQGTFAPDTTYRWMGSIAEDKNGDIGLGYSASSSSIHPSIRYTGRVPSDILGTMETEASLVVGAGSQTTGLSRWGDYTALQVDPTDDCTFWYVSQYEKVSGTFNWSTNIGSFAFTGCGGGGGAIVSLSTATLNFKKVAIGSTSAPKTVTLTNTGSATLNISSITASGDFAISSKTCGSQVTAGASCTVSITFKPTAKGTRKGNLSFTDDAPGSPQIVALTGVGVSIVVNPTALNYATITVGQTSSPQSITVSNVGPAIVTFSGFTLSGTAPADYSITANTCGATIAPGANCSVSVVFKPTVTGKRNAKFNVMNNGGGSPSSATLTGIGG
ncbi:MAG TPA: choice-of-anchor D domain-containing protein [Terriglobales bacterium]|nr:choice-of-anchor D domain-containing protein [Terriglobales bacterium]